MPDFTLTPDDLPVHMFGDMVAALREGATVEVRVAREALPKSMVTAVAHYESAVAALLAAFHVADRGRTFVARVAAIHEENTRPRSEPSPVDPRAMGAMFESTPPAERRFNIARGRWVRVPTTDVELYVEDASTDEEFEVHLDPNGFLVIPNADGDTWGVAVRPTS